MAEGYPQVQTSPEPILTGPVDIELTTAPGPDLACPPGEGTSSAGHRADRFVQLALALLSLALAVAFVVHRTRAPIAEPVAAPAQPAPASSQPAIIDPGLWYNGWVHDGRWRVGIDVWPGVYRARVPIGPVDCRWIRYRRGIGGLYPIAAGGASPGRQASLVIDDRDSVVRTVHCGWWRPQRG